ncbi:MAG TPA: carbohydrate porin [Chthoniobacterales bacterium]|nr:carbohydrate porin [Chthoniobacterales bacterium]
MCFPASFPRLLGLKASLFASLALLTSGAVYAQNSDSSDVTALKAQMEKMQKQYEDRISAMESKMQSLETKSESGSILNTHVLTDADGKQYEGKAPALDESFLKSLTRNFSFSAYVRAGVQFNGSGGGGNFNFEVPDNDGGRARLGNENDTYFELTWKQAHMLGDSPDVMDVSMVFTPAFRYVQNRNTFVTAFGGVPGRENGGNDFDIVWREAYLEMANVFKGAPEITFWGGQRFYDLFNFDPQDYFYLDMSGYGAGVKNIDVGIGKLWLAYLGGLDDDIAAPTSGSFYKHSLDVRLKDIQIGPGKLMLVGIANYEKGNTFTHDFAGGVLVHPVRTNDAYGLGGGAVYHIDLSAIGPKSYLELFALAGFGASNFSTGTDLGTITGFSSNFQVLNPGLPAGVVVNAGNAIQDQRTYRAGAFFVWNPNPCFSLGVWGIWNQDSAGFRQQQSFVNPVFPVTSTGAINLVHQNAAATRNLYTVGIRPIVWITDNIAIQGEAGWNYVDNVRGWAVNGFSGTTTPGSGSNSANGLPIPRPGTMSPTAFSRSGNFLKFTIAPTIKPKGGYYTRPELRVFATYSIWSDSLRGATTPIQEGGNTGGWTPSPYANGKAQDGWLIGTQVEWYL